MLSNLKNLSFLQAVGVMAIAVVAAAAYASTPSSVDTQVTVEVAQGESVECSPGAISGRACRIARAIEEASY